LDALCRAAEDVDRIVLLGDVIELRHGPVRDALAAAAPALRALGGAVAAGARVTVVPGNHDHGLLAGWSQRRARDARPGRLAADAVVDVVSGEPIARIAEWLGAGRAEVEVRYPGVWLRDDVYAHHGHYSDRHVTMPMLERLGAGAMARIAGERDGGPRCADGYEAVLGPMYAWLDALAASGGARTDGLSAGAWRALAPGRRRGLRQQVLGAAFPLGVAALNRLGLGPLRADLSSAELRRSRLVAMGEVAARLDVVERGARWIVFGHSHRAGPLVTDDALEWRTPSGVALINCGSWVRDETFSGPDETANPYRPGFAVTVGEAGAPALVNLLDS
jgi:predicted phosphodiesterase